MYRPNKTLPAMIDTAARAIEPLGYTNEQASRIAETAVCAIADRYGPGHVYMASTARLVRQFPESPAVEKT